MQLSKGHLASHKGYEYFEHNGAVYRAYLINPVDEVTGVRPGRWECLMCAWPLCRKVYGIPTN
jgi:hypothetical protein